MKKMELNQGFTMSRAGENEQIPAQVPGTVYTDLLRAGRMEDPFWKDNEDAALALMDNDYEYTCRFTVDRQWQEEECVLLRFEGLDTITDIYLNDTHVGNTDNMHRMYEFDIKKLLRPENELRVYFHSPTRFIADAYKMAPTRGSEDAMPGFVHLRKAHCMFGWDWGAHLPDAGIFRPVYLIAYSTARLDSVEILQYHEGGKVELTVTPEITFSDEKQRKADGISCEVTVTDPDGVSKTYDAKQRIVIENPKLWWPNGYGEQYLYTVECRLLTADGSLLDTKTYRIGLRTMTISREKDRWGEEFAPIVNGVKLFAMGADYIPEDHLLGRVNEQTTRALLEKCVFANFNMIRVWGGGYYPDDWFFDICDELGIMVWQDFMFACAAYDLTPEFEETITQEFIYNIKRLRHHASLALMCGNNEMEIFFKRRIWVSKDSEVRDYLIMFERIIPSLMKKLAPQVFYWPSSPSSGGSFDDPEDENRGDVHYWDVWHGNKPFCDYRKFFFRFVSEFGFQSFPAMKTIETFTDDPKDYNIFSYIMERHQRNGSANGKIMHYMQQTYLYPSSFETLLYASQLLQADAIRYGVEHFRRNRGRCMGAIYWQLNDCWPVASWASVDYCGRLKALHYFARRFFAPIMISCEEQGMMTSGLQMNQMPNTYEKSIRLCVANESMREEKLTVRWELRNARAEILRQFSREIDVPALSSLWLDKTELPDIDVFGQYISYGVYRSEELLSDGTVNLTYPKYFRYEDPQLDLKVEGDEIVVTAAAYAKSVEIRNENEDLVLSDNYFDMNGGVKRVKIISGDPTGLKLRSVFDIR